MGVRVPGACGGGPCSWDRVALRSFLAGTAMVSHPGGLLFGLVVSLCALGFSFREGAVVFKLRAPLLSVPGQSWNEPEEGHSDDLVELAGLHSS